MCALIFFKRTHEYSFHFQYSYKIYLGYISIKVESYEEEIRIQKLEFRINQNITK
jgi:hypothetical protein